MPDGTKLEKEFIRFHLENPSVYTVLVALAREWVRKTGRDKLGIGMLWERMRWDIYIATSDPEFKLSNNHRAFYARLIMLREKDLHNVFNVKRSAADLTAWEYLP